MYVYGSFCSPTVHEISSLNAGKRGQLQEKKPSEGRSQPLVRERTFGHFCRKFQLPWNAVEGELSACLRDDGVLEVSVKTQDADEAERRKAVSIS